MKCDSKKSFRKSPWGFHINSRGCSPDSFGTEPVVRSRPNPTGVEQFSEYKTGIIYSTPTGSLETTLSANHGFRFTSPAAIIVMTPMGSDTKGGPA